MVRKACNSSCHFSALAKNLSTLGFAPPFDTLLCPFFFFFFFFISFPCPTIGQRGFSTNLP